MLTPNLKLAQQFLSLLDSSAVTFTFQVFDDTEIQDKTKAGTVTGTLEEIAPYLVQKNNDRCGVFVTICETNGIDRKTHNITAPRALFIDCDKKLPQDFHLPPTCKVQSSVTGKGHAYWMIDQRNETDRENFRNCQERLAHYYNSLNSNYECDESVKDLSRVMRLPGFYHMKTQEPFLVTFEASAPTSYSRNSIMQTVPPLPSPNKNSSSRKMSDNGEKLTATIPPRKLALLEEQLKKQCHRMLFANEGERNTTLSETAFVGGRLVADGLVEEVVTSKLWAAAGGAGLDDGEIAGTLLHRLQDGILSKAETEAPKSKHKQLLRIVEETYGSRLTFDVASEMPLLDGIALEVEALVLELVSTYDIEVDLAKLSLLVVEVAKRHKVNTVQNYLNSLAGTSSNAIEHLTRNALGLETALDAVYIRKFLISAVARALDPGCKVDTALVLQGSQGIGKTTFFQALFGKKHFVTIGENANERDDLLVMHRNWCCELGELETVIGRKDISSMKNFLSRQVDEYRSPYARVPKPYTRSFVLVGSTNTTDFLADPTGSRRFWVVKAPHKIDVAWVETNRDAIWLEALELYRAGQQWWLTDEEQEMSSAANKEFETTSPWIELVSSWLTGDYVAPNGVPFTGNKPLTTTAVLLNAIGKQAGCWSKKDEMEVAKVMKTLGYERKQSRNDGQMVRYWVGNEAIKLNEQMGEFF